MFTPFSFTSAKPQIEQQSPLISASLQLAANAKYLDLSPDLKSFLDTLERTIHLSNQKADQPRFPLCLDHCTTLAKTLQSSADLLQSQFELDQKCISTVQQTSSKQFQATEYTSHSLNKLKAGENLHPLQTKLIDEYFVGGVQALEAKMTDLSGRMDKVLQMSKVQHSDGARISENSKAATIALIIKGHNEAILHTAGRLSQLRNK